MCSVLVACECVDASIFRDAGADFGLARLQSVMGVPPGGSVYVPTPGYTYTNNVHKQRLRAFLLPAAASLLLSRRLISDIDQ